MNLLISSFGFGLITASIFALAAVGFTMQFGVTNILNLAYGDIMTASAFVGYTCNSVGLNIWLCLVVGAMFGAVASLLLNRLLFSPFIRRGTKLFGMVIVTLAVGLVIQNTVLAITGPEYLSYSMSVGRTITVGAIELTVSQLGIIAIAIVAMLAVHSLLAYTRLGKAMRATASNPTLARSCGIRTDRIIDVAWLISGALCGVAGITLGMNTTSFNTSTASHVFVVIIAAAILGGVGDAYGAMLGAVIIGLVTEMSAAVIDPAYKDAIAFVILVLVLLLRPQGVRAVVSGQREVAA
jgi:branched-chain amino acid transport system permease protein/neutral amino acid transport system permease protein